MWINTSIIFFLASILIFIASLFTLRDAMKRSKHLQRQVETLLNGHRDARTASLVQVAPEMISQMENSILMSLGLDADLCERILTDMVFMHSQLNSSANHHCPACETTMPDLEKVITRLRSAKITLHDGGDVE